ncbi:MAG: hypothetical protein FJW38_31085 [Acidobacteria bacterium]|nr:hypothetical protein [Acidobacteriota bacterium]
MAKPYAAFLSLIGLHATSWAVFEWLPTDYRIIGYVVPTIVGWALYTYVVCEMFGRVFVSYRGIARTGRRVIAISLLVAVGVSPLTVDQEFGNKLNTISVLVASIGERVVSAAIVVYLLLILLFLRWMPVPLPDNTVRHTVVFFAYFVSGALVFHF